MRNVDSAYLKQLAGMQYKADYEFRLVTQDGRAYPIPSPAVLSAPPSAAVDSGTWEMPVSIMASQMPRGVDPKQYHRIEVDRVVAGNRMPYFRGLIDEVTRGWRKENGAEVEAVNLQAFGVLQKAKGFRVDSLRIDPVVDWGNFKLMGLAKTKSWKPGTPISGGGSETIPYGGATLGIPVIYTDATRTVAYPYGDYTVDTSKVPLKITWSFAPTTTRVIEYQALERFVIPFTPYISHDFFALPEGRDYDDLFHTYVAEFDTTPGSPRIRVADRSGWGTHFHPSLVEFAALVTSDGATHVLAVAGAADADGWVPLAEPVPAGVAAGDPIRLCTTEAMSAWDDACIYQFYDSLGALNEWNRTLFTAYPALGIAVPAPRYWINADEVWLSSAETEAGYIREDVDANRIEEVVKTILTTETGLFTAGDVLTEPTGVYVKNRTWSGYDLADVLAEFKDQAFSPNTFLHDTQDGKITIKPYRQKLEADWVLRGIQGIEETDVPEPVTAVTVVAEADQPVNLAGEWLHSTVYAVNPGYLTDGLHDSSMATTSSSTTNGITAWFKIPTPEPGTIHPLIDSIKITGRGLVTVAFLENQTSGATLVVPGYQFASLKDGTITIPGEAIAKVVTSTAGFLRITIDSVSDTSNKFQSGVVTTPASCSEIEILTKKAGWWRAALTDDTSLAPADQGLDQFGTIWRQPDPAKRMSYRYAPTDYLKRVQPLYPSRAREKVLPMKAISQQDTRDYSERHLDEEVRAGRVYTVTAPYDDRAELGDTTFVAWKGFRKNLFLWSIQGPSNPRDPMARYEFREYDT